jgi:chromosome segregation ATPase
LDEGHSLTAAARIVALEEELSASDDRLREATADLDRRTDELAAAHRDLESARERIAALDGARHARPDGGA